MHTCSMGANTTWGVPAGASHADRHAMDLEHTALQQGAHTIYVRNA